MSLHVSGVTLLSVGSQPGAIRAGQPLGRTRDARARTGDSRGCRPRLQRRAHAGGGRGAARAATARRAARRADAGAPRAAAAPAGAQTAHRVPSGRRHARGHRPHGADARDGRFAGSEIPPDLQRQWIQGTGPAAKPHAPVGEEHPQRRLRAAVGRRRLDVRRRGRARPGLDDVARQPAEPEAGHPPRPACS